MTPAELRKLADIEVGKLTFGFGWMRKAQAALRQAADEIERLSVPYCLGITTIRTLAAEGQAVVAGHAFIAASDLYKQDPYAEVERLKAQQLRMPEMEP
jgi:hypothetical protein